MRDIVDELERIRRRSERAAIATVIAARRSAPRPVGTKMVVSETGYVAGSVSGGCVEGAVVEVADGILRGAPPRLLTFGIADEAAWEVGLPCGGEIDVWVQAYEESPFETVAREGGRAVEVTQLLGPAAGAKLLVPLDGECRGTLGSGEADEQAAGVARELMWTGRSERRGELFFDVLAPQPRLLLFGAVDIAAALCRLARAVDWRPYVIDPRARFASPARFPDALGVIAAWPEAAFRELGGIDQTDSIAVLTHDPKLDDEALTLALRSSARFVGAMGSRRAQEARRQRLLAAGLSEAELDRLAAPLGLDLGAGDGMETALSIFAEVVAVRHGRAGGRLRDAQGRIHEVIA